MRDSFIFYKSFYDSIQRIKNKELKADIFEAICELALNNNDIELTDDIGLMIMDLIKPQILANSKRYEDGKKGGRPCKKTSGYSDEKTSGYENKKPVGGKNKKPNNNVNVNDNVNVNNIKEKINKKEKYYENENLNNIFIEFLQIRKKLKAVNSERAIKMLLKKLSKYDDETKYKMIEQSIVNSWKDVYEIKNIKQIPKWIDKKIEKEELNESEKQEMENLFKDFK